MNPALRAQLEALHAQLKQADASDPEARKLLALLATDIDDLLVKPGSVAPGVPNAHRTLAERLHTVAVRFEAEHPALGKAARSLIDTLSNAGI
jgi:hypothetical protein